jgi:hypothetical protein
MAASGTSASAPIVVGPSTLPSGRRTVWVTFARFSVVTQDAEPSGSASRVWYVCCVPGTSPAAPQPASGKRCATVDVPLLENDSDSDRIETVTRPASSIAALGAP